MAYYLLTDGTDDKLVAPSMAFTKIVMDMDVEHKTGVAQMYVDFRPSIGFTSFYRNASNNDLFDSINSVKVDGVSKTTNTQFIPSNTRCLVEVEDSVGTTSLTFFSHNGNAQYTKAKVYDIKIYNGATLQAHYDMTTQTVQDQTGNGRHATLTGGTWVDDGAGGTPVTVNSIVSTITTSAVSPTVDAQKQVTISSIVSNGDTTFVNPSVSSNVNITIGAIVSTVNTQAIPPNIIAESPNVSISSAVSSVSLNAVSPIIGIDNNVVSVVLNAMISANAPIIEILNDVEYYEQVLRTTFNINRSLETTFEINRSLRTTFKI